jgi:hypothetical protein
MLLGTMLRILLEGLILPAWLAGIVDTTILLLIIWSILFMFWKEMTT